MNADDLRQLCTNFGLATIADRIVALSLPAARIKLRPTTEGEVLVGASHFGGSPDFWQGAVWPRRRSRRVLTFVMQVNLSECWQYLDEKWPSSGIIYYFFDAGSSPGGHSLEDNDATWIAYSKNTEDLQRSPRPQPIRDVDPSPRPVLPSATINFEPILTIPSPYWMSEYGELSRSDHDNYLKLYREFRNRYGDSEVHQIGGYAQEHQEGRFVIAAAGCSGIDRERVPDGHPASRALYAQSQSWRLLIQLDTQNGLHGSWKYGGDRLYVYAHEESISNKTFDKYWTVIDVD